MTAETTRLLEAIQQGDSTASDQLLPLVYEDLRKMAAMKLSRERPGQTLQATALVHEAWLRLGGGKEGSWENRGHFFAAVACFAEETIQSALNHFNRVHP